MQRWCSKVRCIAASAAYNNKAATILTQNPLSLTYHNHNHNYSYPPSGSRLIHSLSPYILQNPYNPPSLSLYALSNPPFPLHFSFIQVRHLTKKEYHEKMKKYRPRTPVTSKLKKYKIKCYSSFKGRFRLMADGQIRRWKEGKRHNAHLKSKKAKRRGRQPGVVPPAYAKVMKKLNFCG